MAKGNGDGEGRQKSLSKFPNRKSGISGATRSPLKKGGNFRESIPEGRPAARRRRDRITELRVQEREEEE